MIRHGIPFRFRTSGSRFKSRYGDFLAGDFKAGPEADKAEGIRFLALRLLFGTSCK